MRLVWEFKRIQGSETIQNVRFSRSQRDVAGSREEIARNANEGPFTVFSKFIPNYDAEKPVTLSLKTAVTNDDEFIYHVEITYVGADGGIVPSLTDDVQVIVFGK